MTDNVRTKHEANSNEAQPRCVDSWKTDFERYNKANDSLSYRRKVNHHESFKREIGKKKYENAAFSTKFVANATVCRSLLDADIRSHSWQ